MAAACRLVLVAACIVLLHEGISPRRSSACVVLVLMGKCGINLGDNPFPGR